MSFLEEHKRPRIQLAKLEAHPHSIIIVEGSMEWAEHPDKVADAIINIVIRDIPVLLGGRRRWAQQAALHWLYKTKEKIDG